MNRGARRQPAFLLDDDCGSFLHLLGVIRDQYGVEVHAYCLMGNHFHLLAHSPGANLSEAMQYLLAVYTRRFNDRHGVDGALFRGRFRSKVIDHDAYLLQASRYIHRNPLDIDPTMPLAGHRWSSYSSYVVGRPGLRWLELSAVLGLVGHDTNRYRAYVERPQPTDEIAVPTPDAQSASSSEHRPDDPVQAPVLAVESAVVRATGIPPVHLRSARRGRRNPARQLVLLLATDGGAVSPDDLADRYGFSNRRSLDVALTRARRLVANDQTAAELYERARHFLIG